MRRLFLVISIPTLMLAGAASADTRGPARQCPAPWNQAALERQCVEGGVCRTAYSGENGMETHVLSKAEIRAELDAIRLDRTDTRLAARSARQPSGE